MGAKHLEKFDRLVDDAVAQAFTGWDFSYVDERMVQANTSWDYHSEVQSRIAQADALLDMCTGGGEFLNSFAELPRLTYASEGYPPNVSIAQRRLEKRDVCVVDVSASEKLALPADTFDLVINRHGEYSPEELQRIMKPGGSTFYTQQVGSENTVGLNEVLGAPSATAPVWQLDIACEQLTSCGFTIVQSAEEFPVVSFRDIGAVVFYLQAVPWQIPDFSVENYRRALVDLHERIELNGSYDTHNHRFLLEATLE